MTDTQEHEGLTAQGLLAQKHALEQALLKRHGELVTERQQCEDRIQKITAELKATGFKPSRKPRAKK